MLGKQETGVLLSRSLLPVRYILTHLDKTLACGLLLITDHGCLCRYRHGISYPRMP